MDFKGQLHGFGIGFKDTFSGELNVGFSVKSNNYQEEFIYTVEVREMAHDVNNKSVIFNFVAQGFIWHIISK